MSQEVSTWIELPGNEQLTKQVNNVDWDLNRSKSGRVAGRPNGFVQSKIKRKKAPYGAFQLQSDGKTPPAVVHMCLMAGRLHLALPYLIVQEWESTNCVPRDTNEHRVRYRYNGAGSIGVK